MIINMKLSDNLKRIRKENNLSQEQLAEKLNVSRQAVSKWESEQSYPETEKLLQICNMFNFTLDELVNENVSEVNETKESKLNFNKYIEDFFGFITKTVNMFCCMSFKQKLKCIGEQIGVAVLLLAVLSILGAVFNFIVSTVIGILPAFVYSPLMSMVSAVIVILCMVVGITVFLHIFKIRYLDYYEIVKDTDLNDDTEYGNEEAETIEESTYEEDKKAEKNGKKTRKFFMNNAKEKVIIRDPSNASFKFLNGLFKIVLMFIKFLAGCVGLFAAGFLVFLVACLVVGFMFVKSGAVFWGGLLCLIATGGVTFIVIELMYNFIVSKKNPRKRMVITFISSIAAMGIGLGLIPIGVTGFSYNSIPQDFMETDNYTFDMRDDLVFQTGYPMINYEESDSNKINITVERSKFYESEYSVTDNILHGFVGLKNGEDMKLFKEIINDVNRRQVNDYSYYRITVKTSPENMKKLRENTAERQRETSAYDELDDKYNALENKYDEILSKYEVISEENTELKDKIQNKEEQINELEEQILEKTNIINELANQ